MEWMDAGRLGSAPELEKMAGNLDMKAKLAKMEVRPTCGGLNMTRCDGSTQLYVLLYCLVVNDGHHFLANRPHKEVREEKGYLKVVVGWDKRRCGLLS
jgi:hypothetical protein